MPNSERPIGFLLAAFLLLAPLAALAQDVPGFELCTRESNIERRTGCLQSNVEYLQKLVARNAAAAQQKLDAAQQRLDAAQQRLDSAHAEIAALKAALAALHERVEKLQTAAAKPGRPDAK